ncbi:MAG: hypothetical protein DRN78_03460 [Thermoproteota archaeon]|nr:MAG: hypothetical protein DRN78_03460 [Candidatus Korarchaeota archaeon]
MRAIGSYELEEFLKRRAEEVFLDVLGKCMETAKKLDLGITEMRMLVYRAILRFLSELIAESSDWDVGRIGGLSIRMDDVGTGEGMKS